MFRNERECNVGATGGDEAELISDRTHGTNVEFCADSNCFHSPRLTSLRLASTEAPRRSRRWLG